MTAPHADHSVADTMTTAQVAELLNRSSATVRRLAASGRLPAKRFGTGPNAPLVFDAEQVARLVVQRYAARNAP